MYLQDKGMAAIQVDPSIEGSDIIVPQCDGAPIPWQGQGATRVYGLTYRQHSPNLGFGVAQPLGFRLAQPLGHKCYNNWLEVSS